MKESAVYYWTYDNPRNGNYRGVLRRLERIAHVEATAPKTSFRLEPRKGRDFSDLRDALEATLDPRSGRGALFSMRTGNVFVIDNRGNRPGRFIRQPRGRVVRLRRPGR